MKYLAGCRIIRNFAPCKVSNSVLANGETIVSTLLTIR